MPEIRGAIGEPIVVDVGSLDLEANGVAHHEGKVVFVRGALPGERVRAAIVRRKPRFDVAQAFEVLRESHSRVAPRCPHFGVCGGCSMQHLEPRAQLAIKQRALEDQLWHIGRVRPGTVLRPIAGPAWGYRYRARLSVRNVPKKGGVLVGFHEKGSSYVADMRECHVLPGRMSDMLLPLRELVGSLSLRERLPQIEVAIGESPLDRGRGAGPGGDPDAGPAPVATTPGQGGDLLIALVLRVLEPPTDEDRAKLLAFAARERVELWLQPKGPDSIRLLCTRDGAPAAGDAASQLGYRLAEFGVDMPYRPTDFTQVNHRINEVLVSRALRLLDPQPGERIADLFCGLGNFTLPLARRASEVIGIEGSPVLTRRAQENAAVNGLAGRTAFRTANLFELTAEAWSALGRFDRVLIDPPREGALEVAKVLSADPVKPRRIVYVSCNPATLARDAAILVHQGGFALKAAGAVNMFPQTSHVESIAVFEPDPEPRQRCSPAEEEPTQ
ncbi:23S rRNA (uracil(1939)-C(5))-methyltransferase RlmD [Burkholderiaceae bacterium FT117]|uniref:23S rRNA (uracil(1939)-C(5))-methyltransferase RlmD n=1 Tax=Zeimonas sediminis TaxID=2944268 RepID=UPI002342C20A|nr:23S rRNA (uracil(1939)-C(5))-methyltransferase RlmD [Zeimonas sediminis]MCM5571940.1 23S rRNA (uracil(1939)-C(5))-methyltransferase RlmD [Zeimonas sediminis]